MVCYCVRLFSLCRTTRRLIVRDAHVAEQYLAFTAWFWAYLYRSCSTPPLPIAVEAPVRTRCLIMLDWLRVLGSCREPSRCARQQSECCLEGEHSAKEGRNRRRVPGATAHFGWLSCTSSVLRGEPAPFLGHPAAQPPVSMAARLHRYLCHVRSPCDCSSLHLIYRLYVISTRRGVLAKGLVHGSVAGGSATEQYQHQQPTNDCFSVSLLCWVNSENENI